MDVNKVVQRCRIQRHYIHSFTPTNALFPSHPHTISNCSNGGNSTKALFYLIKSFHHLSKSIEDEEEGARNTMNERMPILTTSTAVAKFQQTMVEDEQRVLEKYPAGLYSVTRLTAQPKRHYPSICSTGKKMMSSSTGCKVNWGFLFSLPAWHLQFSSAFRKVGDSFAAYSGGL